MNKHAFNCSVRLLQIKAYILTCTTIQAQNIHTYIYLFNSQPMESLRPTHLILSLVFTRCWFRKIRCIPLTLGFDSLKKILQRSQENLHFFPTWPFYKMR